MTSKHKKYKDKNQTNGTSSKFKSFLSKSAPSRKKEGETTYRTGKIIQIANLLRDFTGYVNNFYNWTAKTQNWGRWGSLAVLPSLTSWLRFLRGMWQNERTNYQKLPSDLIVIIMRTHTLSQTCMHIHGINKSMFKNGSI